MTLGALMSWGFGKSPPAAPPIERYHSGSGGYWEHKSHGHGHGHGGWKSHGGGGKGGGAALSALALLAFLFLINVMQQSLQDNNATAPTTGTTLFLRDGLQPVSLTARASEKREKTAESHRQREGSVFASSGTTTKGDIPDRRDDDNREYIAR